MRARRPHRPWAVRVRLRRGRVLAEQLAIAAQRFTADRKIDPKALGVWLSRHQGNIAGRAKLMIDRTGAKRTKWYIDIVGV